MFLSKIRQHAREVERPVLYLTALGIVYFALTTGWAVMNFVDYLSSSRPAARISSPLLLALGICISALGVLARRLGFGLFGVAILLFGLGHGLALVRLERGLLQQLMVGILLVSVVVALMSLVIQVRNSRR